MAGYTKLFASILESTVWLESPPVKVVWITLLAMADRDGIVEASVPGLAKRAGVERGHCEQALAVFLAPDPDSRTIAHEGRRIEVVPGGWRLLNYDFYRLRASADDAAEKNAARQRRYRALHVVTSVTSVTSNDIASSSSSSDADQEKSAATSATPPAMTFPTVGTPQRWDLSEEQIVGWSSLYPGVDVRSECRKALAWVQANRRKTARGMPRFLVAWLSRSVDSGRGQTTGTGSEIPPIGCKHSPACASDQAHTKRRTQELRA